jgi:glucose-6-phosphate isomerase
MATSGLKLNLEHVRLERNEVVRHAASLRTALSSLDTGEQGGFIRLPHRTDLLSEIQRYGKQRPTGITDVVQLGIGGSSLGAHAICAALLPARHNEFVGKGQLRYHFADNVDPESFGALLDALEPRKTLVHVVSKSGGTLETAAQLHALLESFREVDKRFPVKRNLVITTGAKGTLRDYADEKGIPTLLFPDDVGGRFSVFTASGLLVPALCGVPIAKILAGARRMDARCRDDALVGPAGRLAGLFFEHDQVHERPIHVDFIYADALQLVGDWFGQLWAESLGKSGRGPTPVVARGTTDQHSQLQLYTEGPDDKVYTVIRVEKFRDQVKIGRDVPLRELAGKQLATVFAAEAQGTTEALLAQGRPVVEIELPRITPELIGELLFLRQLQTALAGTLYRVNPFDQPGVEAGKLAALKILRGESG